MYASAVATCDVQGMMCSTVVVTALVCTLSALLRFGRSASRTLRAGC